MAGECLIETERLILRTVTPADVAGVAASWKLDEGPIPYPEAERVIQKMRANHVRNRPGKIWHLCLAILSKETGEFIGWCGLDHTQAVDADPALFYLLKAGYWGRGLATEAARALLEYAFTRLELASIHGGCAPENLASKRVMEKIGMQDIGQDAEGGYAFTISREAFLKFLSGL